MKVLCISGLLFISFTASAQIVTDLIDFNTKMTVSGTQEVPLLMAAYNGYACTTVPNNANPFLCVEVNYVGTLNGILTTITHDYYGALNQPCPESVYRYWPDTSSQRGTNNDAARSAYETWLNSKLPTVLPLQSPPAPPGFVVQKTTISGLSSACKHPLFPPNGIGYNAGGSSVNVVNPPEENQSAVCNLNSQNLNLSYSAASLDVNGLSKSTNLVINCTAGDAQNYTLKLTGSNVTNGRLNFGNGVSAQVSLNGTPVAANGVGISLNGLTSQTLPVSASLVGTASGPGVTNANGVLVLDAL